MEEIEIENREKERKILDNDEMKKELKETHGMEKGNEMDDK